MIVYFPPLTMALVPWPNPIGVSLAIHVTDKEQMTTRSVIRTISEPKPEGIAHGGRTGKIPGPNRRCDHPE